jgi:gliding motility-associated-like protein
MQKSIFFLTFFFCINGITIAQVVINEVHVKPSGGDTDQAFQSMYNSTPNFGSEFVEIYNTSSCSSVDISCWTIGGMDGGTNGGAFSFPEGTVIAPLSFITVGGPNTPGVTFNLNLAANSARLWRSNAARWHLPNGDGWMALYDATGTAVNAVYWTFASNDPTKLNSDATYTTGALQRIGVCGGGGLATASSIPGIEYIPQATVTGQSYERSTDGGNTWVLGTATPNNCNGICTTSSAFQLNATVAQPTCGNNNGSISFAPSPSDTYFYTWPFPSNWTVNSVNNLAPGIYPVTITNDLGCSIDTTIVLTDIPCGNVCDPNGNLVIYSNYDGGILTINADQNISDLRIGICTYEPIQVNFTGPFVGNITQVIYAGMNSDQNNNNCGLGNFTTTVTGVPAGIVTISPPMNPPLVGYTPAHGNGAGPWGGQMIGVAGLCDTTVNAGGGNTPDEVVYYFLNATGGTLLYHQTQYACWVNETVNVSTGGNCCILPSVSNPCPTLTFATSAQTNVSCFGGNNGAATVTASGGQGPYTYTWTPGNLNSGTQSNLTADTYTVNVTDNNNCPGSTTVTITQPATAVSVSASSVDATCGSNNGSATANATGGTGTITYSWAPGGGTTPTISSLSSDTYTVTVTDANGCTATANTSVGSAGGPTLTLSNSSNVSCNGLSDGSATVAGSGGTGTLTYNWMPGNLSGATQNALSAANYTVTVTDGSGCSNTLTVTINEPTAVVAAPGTITAANCGSTDGSASVTASGGTGTLTYTWTPNVSTTASATTIAAGSYSVVVADANGCSQTVNLVVPSIGGPTVTVTDVEGVSCLGDSDGTATAVATGGNPPFTYQWTPTGGANATATGLSAGNYSVLVTDDLGCIGTADVTISSPAAINVTGIVTDAGCGTSDGQIAANASGGTGTFTYLWTPGGQTTSTITGLAGGNYSVTATDGNGCTAIENYVVSISGELDITVIPEFATINEGETVQIVASGATSYSWTPANGLSCTNCPNPIASPSLTTTYIVTGTDGSGCTGTATVTIFVTQVCGELFIPTVFSPNENGPSINNTLCVMGNCISELNYAVFNRWGEKVFETTDPESCWDGTYKGQPVNSGVYVYKIYAKLFDNTVIEESGNLTVVR